jgi:hypothetical protein
MFGIPTVLSLGYRALDQKHEDGEFKWYVTPDPRGDLSVLAVPCRAGEALSR